MPRRDLRTGGGKRRVQKILFKNEKNAFRDAKKRRVANRSTTRGREKRMRGTGLLENES